MPEAVWIVGDPQGWPVPFGRVLCEAGLIDSSWSWTGGNATLVVAGDLVDNGPDGIGVIDLLMRLQSESGGRVHVVVGNHDVQLLAAYRFDAGMVDEWLAKGGVRSDLERLTDARVEWLCELPAMVLVQDALVLHADALCYREYGTSVEEVNASFGRLLRGNDVGEWKRLLEQFGEHRAFLGLDGELRLSEFLQTFGGSRLVHGHTPIARMREVAPQTVTQPYIYCSGRCVNVDPGIYLGGQGFAYRLTTR